ncbi:MAG: putative DNA-binding domain-containing protein [Myxococcota bacterium]
MSAMGLAERQSRVARVCFDREPDPADLEALGASARWLLYRSMVRERLRSIIATALPRTRALLGEGHFEAAFGRWLQGDPPRTRYIREVPPAFVRFALPLWEADEGVPPWVTELAQYELARWEVRYEEGPQARMAELEFDRIPAVHPSVRLLRLEHHVHERVPEGQAPRPAPVNLLIWRSPAHQVEVWTLDDLAAELVVGWQRGDQTVSETVQRVAARRGIAIDPPFVQKLAEIMARLLRQGVLQGSLLPTDTSSSVGA